MAKNPDSREWNAELYHQISAPQVSWGKKVLARISLRGDETVLDAGCGTGRLTRELLEALPHGQVVALDASQNMLDAARAYLEPEFAGRVEFVCCDLLQMPFEKKIDGIFSTAAFHWVLDHERLFQELHRALRPGAWLCAQCGGEKNLEHFLARVQRVTATQRYSKYFAGFAGPWEFSDAEMAAARMRRAGFEEIEASIEEAPTEFPDAQAFRQFVESVVLRHHIERISDRAAREEFLDDVTREAATGDPPFLLDYWRLNLRGKRAAIDG